MTLTRGGSVDSTRTYGMGLLPPVPTHKPSAQKKGFQRKKGKRMNKGMKEKLEVERGSVS